MKKLILITLLIASGWYVNSHYKQQVLSLINSTQDSFDGSRPKNQTKCISKDGKTFYGIVPKNIKCVKRIKVDGSITIIPSNPSSDSESQDNDEEDSKASPYNCDGRTHCSQMSSCSEAFFFNKNCPNTEMDGDNDGTPCEKQWCN